jgi:hypothetical protein
MTTVGISYQVRADAAALGEITSQEADSDRQH